MNKKMLLSIGSLGAIVAPMAAVVACGDSDDESDTNKSINDSKGNPSSSLGGTQNTSVSPSNTNPSSTGGTTQVSQTPTGGTTQTNPSSTGGTTQTNPSSTGGTTQTVPQIPTPTGGYPVPNQVPVVTQSLSSVNPSITTGVGSWPTQTSGDYSGSAIADSDALRTAAYAGEPTRVVTQKAVDGVDTLIAEMNKDADISWHTIGEPMVDAINGVRYAIRQTANAASNSEVVREALKDFTSETFPIEYVNDPNAPLHPAFPFVEEARNDVNNWLNHAIPPLNDYPLITYAMMEPSFHGTNMTYGYRQFVRTPAEMKLMEPLRLSRDMTAWTQYRAQQVEWLGSFDGHDSAGTTATAVRLPGAAGFPMVPNLAAPEPWTAGPDNGENFVFFHDTAPSSAPAALKSSPSETNIYSAMMTAVSTLYDDLDASYSTGHRSNFYFPENDRIGYAPVIKDTDGAVDKAHAFVFTATWNSQDLVSNTLPEVRAREQEMQWVKDLWGDEVFKFVLGSAWDAETFLRTVMGIDPYASGGPAFFGEWAAALELRAKAGEFANKQEMKEAAWTQSATFSSPVQTPTQQTLKGFGDFFLLPSYYDISNSTIKYVDFDVSNEDHISGYAEVGMTEETVLPYDILGSGSLSIHFDGAEPTSTLDALWSL